MHIIKQQIQKARKEHCCNWCGGVIYKEEKYQYSFIMNDDPYHFKSHLHCLELTHALDMWKYDNGDGLEPDCFSECINEKYTEMQAPKFNEFRNDERTDLEDRVLIVYNNLKKGKNNGK